MINATTTWFMYGKCRLAAAMKRQLSLCDVQNAVTRSENTLNFWKVIKACYRYRNNLGVKPDAEKRKTVNKERTR